MIVPKDLTPEALFKWQAQMEADLERVLLANTEAVLSIVVSQAASYDLTAASARFLWEEAVTRSVIAMGLMDDRFLLEDLLAEDLGSEAYETVQQVMGLRIPQEELRAALIEALDIKGSLVAAGVLRTVLNWKIRIKRAVRTGFTGLVGRLLLAEFRFVGVPFKTWITKMDDRVRHTHQIAHGQTVPTDQAFRVGNESLMYPGEHGKAIEEIANCRCIIVPG